MKKLMPVFLCLLLACGLLAGCGGGSSAKIPPENFPHSETLRLDATVEEVVKAEGLKKMDDENFYEAILVKINGLEFTLYYDNPLGSNRCFASYFLKDESTDLEKAYQQLVQYFTDVYGEAPSEAPNESDDVLQILESQMWTYMLEGNEYCIEVHRQVVNETAELMVMAGPMEMWDM